MRQRTGAPYVLLLGEAEEGVRQHVARAAQAAGLDVRGAAELAAARDSVEQDGNAPTAILLDLSSQGAVRHALDVRGRHGLEAVVLLGLCARVDDEVFAGALRAGCDDCCLGHGGGLERRLQLLAQIEPVTLRPHERSVVVADAAREARLRAARIFRHAGFRVVFSLTGADAVREAARPGVVAVVCSAEIVAQCLAQEIAADVRAQASRPAWIVNAASVPAPAVRARLGLAAHVRLAVHDLAGSPADLLFLANRLLRDLAQESRTSERLLYGTSVWYRAAGREEGEHGFTYNLGAGGLFVRTLAPPQRWDELWIELRPPGADRLVHLEAMAVWSRCFGPGEVEVSPCGFGARVTGGSVADLDRYRRAVEAHRRAS
ncbi:MAG: hypothetical protein HY744_30930 [Deltaproteobacteria bacterium]|nr:hypothetical protein [Deltaproteobacteria bacterium]